MLSSGCIRVSQVAVLILDYETLVVLKEVSGLYVEVECMVQLCLEGPMLLLLL